ncbi:twin-arginine translocase TatA/TatE family subunit [Vulgatibacter sp.]|uniref:Sec-independent protein translocase subunit TatA/TatB n=1 Tax=Vulgatibacter sp. TaxID=1971226 RepID=UPI003563B0DE
MFGMRGSELLIIFAVILLLFGATRLPALGKALGEGLKNFKKGINTAGEDEVSETDAKPKV